MSGIFVVTRSFQGGSTFETFDRTKFEKGVADPLRKLLSTAPVELGGMAVVTCGASGNKCAEEIRHDRTPTVAALQEAFPEEIGAGRIVPVVCFDWGLNPGSATALNAGIEMARERGAERVLCWSPELDLDGRKLVEMLEHQDRYALSVVGYLRSRYWLRYQWRLPQNNCALWKADLLAALHGFNPECNGDGKTTVDTKEFGAVPLAGMEDFEACLRTHRLVGQFPRWGMVGGSHPAFWNLALKKPGTEEHDNNMKKIARQELVIREYARCAFPDREVDDVLEDFFKARINV